MMNKNNNKKASKKNWFLLGVVGTALLLVPRRSSRQPVRDPKDLVEKNDNKAGDNSTQSNSSDYK